MVAVTFFADMMKVIDFRDTKVPRQEHVIKKASCLRVRYVTGMTGRPGTKWRT